MLRTLRAAFEKKEVTVIRTIDGKEYYGLLSRDPILGHSDSSYPVVRLNTSDDDSESPVTIALSAISAVYPYVAQRSVYEDQDLTVL